MNPLVAVLGLLAGLSIGTVGIGGVILVPVLTFALGYDLQTAIATSSFSFLFAGISGTVAYTRQGTIPWRMVTWITVGIVPGAIVGARTNAAVPTVALVFAVAGLMIFSGLNTLRNRTADDSPGGSLNLAQMVIIGLVLGFGSSITGTGGPVILVPILLWVGIPTILAIGSSQAVQIPIALAATIGYLLFGNIDVTLGITLGVSQAVGVMLGAVIAHRTHPARLRMMVAVSLIIVGAYVGIRAIT